jgi:hypothetical protein
MRNFIKDKRANVSVGLMCIILIPITFSAWLVCYMPTAMLIDTLSGMTDNANALNIFNIAKVVCSALLIGEVLTLIVWWLASAFRKEDQTYQVGY